MDSQYDSTERRPIDFLFFGLGFFGFLLATAGIILTTGGLALTGGLLLLVAVTRYALADDD